MIVESDVILWQVAELCFQFTYPCMVIQGAEDALVMATTLSYSSWTIQMMNDESSPIDALSYHQSVIPYNET